MDCTCLDFCAFHGRDHVEHDDHGEFCGECVRDGGMGELCTPSAESCFPGSTPQVKSVNEWERQFMCGYHALLHKLFCWASEFLHDLSGNERSE